MEPTLRISEIFVSVQGEGVLSGIPSTFVRTSGCNLRCRWCDTPETSWRPSGERQSIDQILQTVGDAQPRHVVLTGGEPLIAPHLSYLAAALKAEGLHITLETAASHDAPPALLKHIDLASISPKLADSTPRDSRFALRHEARRFRPEVIRALMGCASYQLKFVPSKEADLEEIESIVTQLGANTDRVLLMPEGTSVEAIDQAARWLVPACIRRGYRYCDRTHIRLFGHTRGT